MRKLLFVPKHAALGTFAGGPCYSLKPDFCECLTLSRLSES
jgi:hypothetical protein